MNVYIDFLDNSPNNYGDVEIFSLRNKWRTDQKIKNKESLDFLLLKNVSFALKFVHLEEFRFVTGKERKHLCSYAQSPTVHQLNMLIQSNIN